MDEINDFFDTTKEFVREVVPRGCVSGSSHASAIIKPEKPIKREHDTRSYAHDVVREQERMLYEFESSDEEKPTTSNYCPTIVSSCMDELEYMSDDDVKPKINRIEDDVYQKYHFDLRRDESLPIHDNKDEIVTTIRKHPVVIIEGDTGCGKTTQVPQYILDDAYRRNEYCKIVCTQPRRIAAISIANRVSDERKWEKGTVVGHKVGLHHNMSEDTRLLYCTTGVLLQKLIKEKSLQSYTHIILDEVHERDQDMDFLLIVIRHYLASNSKRVKVILMSATINTREFSEYFKIRNCLAPVIRADNRRLYQVREFYFDDLDRINAKDYEIDYNDPGISQEMFSIALKLIIVIDNIEKQEAELNVHAAAANKSTSILVFLPGINEIDQLCKRLQQLQETNENSNVKLAPIRLHSLISPDEQVKVFHQAPPGYRKIILATNIAESSITVPDVKYVIDFCLTKTLVTDTNTNFTSLHLLWASRANCRQRSGRAGRVMNGRVYRMVTKEFYRNFMEEFSMPEMLRCPLETVVLKAKLLELGPPPNILSLAMSPPNLADIHNTILILKEVGALYKYANDVYSVQDGDITFMGRVMAALPLDIRLSRLILLGYMFSVLEQAIIIAAGLSVRSIFKTHNSTKRLEAEAFIQKLIWADGSGSDLFAMLKAYYTWASMREHHNMREGEGENSWAVRYFLNLRSIKEMHLLVMELKERLQSFGIKEQTSYQRVHYIDREKTIILKIIIAGAFYPNYFTRSNLNDLERERSIYHTLSGNEPCNTVYFTGFNTRHIGQLYTRSIKELFADMRIEPKNISVRFQPGSERVFVTFENDHKDEQYNNDRKLLVPGRVRPEVYKAVRMRSIGMRTNIRVMDARAGIKYAEDRGIGVMRGGTWNPTKKISPNPELIVLPSVFQKTIRGYITHVENCGKFYFQPLSEMDRLREIHTLLNKSAKDACRFRTAAAISKGMMLSALYGNTYSRARVLAVNTVSREQIQFKVFFVDYGNTEKFDFQDLRRLPFEAESLVDIPPRMFECRLAMVQPSSVKCPSGYWPEESTNIMRDLLHKIVELEIYSLVESVASVIIKVETGTLNEMLVDKGLARKSDENYMSKSDHDLRLRKQTGTYRYLDEDHSRQNEEYLRSLQRDEDLDVEPPPGELCLKNMQLRGPFSPLETSIFSAIRVGAWRSVNIERESVNYVLLDTDPQDVHERLVVAASISQIKNGDVLTARSTTLMPSIHGFGALMTMLFCPTMQIKCNKNRTKYVTILAGLGHDEETYEPLFAEHDIVLNLDTDILPDDLESINNLRYCMDTILHVPPGDERPFTTASDRANLTAKIKNLIIKLLSKDRKYIETHTDYNDNVWQRFDTSEFYPFKDVYGKRSIFPLHTPQRLYDERFDRKHALAVHCEELHCLRQFDGSDPITCQLCNQSLENIVQLRIHLLSQLHRDLEHKISFKPKN